MFYFCLTAGKYFQTTLLASQQSVKIFRKLPSIYVTKNKIAGLYVQKCFWNVSVLEINNSTLIFEVMSS